MGLLRTPIESKVDIYLNGLTLNLTRTLLSETQDTRQVAVFESATRLVPSGIIPLPAPARTNPELARLVVDFAQRMNQYYLLDGEISGRLQPNGLSARGVQREVDRQNSRAEWLNNRVCEALSRSTGVDLGAKPTQWWQWWQDYNDLHAVDEKPREYAYVREDRLQSVGPVAIPYVASCLAAGTVVWTNRGPVPVESVQVGDLALSKHPETGELAYKPVLRTTVRPAESLLDVTVGGESFTCTRGHTFWVSGHGWMKIRDVEPGMWFHGATKPAELEACEEAADEPVYNLVVADVHTYFVGREMILSHDPTFAEPTDTLVPGLAVTHAAQ
jgi:hypothetical protein